MELSKIFEDTVFGKMDQSKKHINHVAIQSSVDFEETVASNLLKFDLLREFDKGVRIISTDKGYDIRLKKHYKSFDLASLFNRDNAGVEFKFDEDVINFEPDEEMMFKSKVPLWVIKPISGNRVLITRMW